jgi:hypothetical protein
MNTGECMKKGLIIFLSILCIIFGSCSRKEVKSISSIYVFGNNYDQDIEWICGIWGPEEEYESTNRIPIKLSWGTEMIRKNQTICIDLLTSKPMVYFPDETSPDENPGYTPNSKPIVDKATNRMFIPFGQYVEKAKDLEMVIEIIRLNETREGISISWKGFTGEYGFWISQIKGKYYRNIKKMDGKY